MADVTFTIKLQGQNAGAQAAVQQVVTALKQLGIQAKVSGAATGGIGAGLKQSTVAVNGMAKAVSALKGLLAGLSLAFVAHRFKELALAQLENAAAVGRLSQALGIGTEALSVFQFAARDANVDSETLTNALRNLATAQQQAKNPTSAQALALKSLGISAKEVAGLSLDKFFLRVANASAQFAASGQKLTALGTVLGPRVIVPLIPLLQKLAGEGFAKATEEAKRFGLIISEDTARKAADFEDALSRLQGSVRGLAGEFALGLAPKLTEVFDALTVGAAEGEGAMKDLGSTTGGVFKLLITGIATLGNMLANTFDILKTGLAIAAAPGSFVGELTGLRQRAADRDSRLEEMVDNLFPSPERVQARMSVLRGQIQKFQLVLRNAAKARGEKPQAWENLTGLTEEALTVLRRRLESDVLKLKGGKGVDLADPAGVKAAHDAGVARVEAIVDGIRAGITKQKAGFDLEQQQAEEHYRLGLQAAEDFFADRRLVIEQAADDEIAALTRARNAIATRPVANEAEKIKRAQDVAKVDEEIAARRALRFQQQAENDNKQAASQEVLHKEALDFEQKMLEAQGKVAAAAKLALAEQLRDERKKMIQRGDSPEQADAALAAITTIEEAKIDLADLSAQAGLVFGGLERDVGAINALVAAHVISASEGEKQILQLQKERLPTLDAIRDSLLRLQGVITDKASLDGLKALVGQIDALQLHTTIAVGVMADFRRELIDAVPSVVTDQLGLISDILRGTNEDIHSAADAFKAFALIAVNAIQQIIVKLIALKIQETIAGLILGGAGAASGGGTTVLPGAGFAAAGGYVVGPRHSGGGKRIEVEGGEYIFDRASVRRFGPGRMRQLHAYLRGASAMPSPIPHPGGRYAGGGAVTALTNDASDRVGGMLGIRVGLEPGLVGELMESSRVKQAIIKIVQEHPRALNRHG